MKLHACYALLAACLAPSLASAVDLRDRAQSCASAMIGTDPDAAIECMNPRVVASLGGKEAAERSLARQRSALEESGAKLEGVTIGAPEEPIVLNGRAFALVPETLRIRTKDGVVMQKPYLLAIREKDAEVWTFVDAGPALPQALPQLFPDTSPQEFEKLKIPVRPLPALEP